MSAFCLLGHSRLKGFGKGVPGREVRFPPDGKEGDLRSGAITDSLFFWHPPTRGFRPPNSREKPRYSFSLYNVTILWIWNIFFFRDYLMLTNIVSCP